MPQVGEQLELKTAGSYSGTVDSLSYRWQRSADGVSGWADIAGETGTIYTLQAADVGEYVALLETATNAGGSVDTRSAVEGPITTDVVPWLPEYEESLFVDLDAAIAASITADGANQVSQWTDQVDGKAFTVTSGYGQPDVDSANSEIDFGGGGNDRLTATIPALAGKICAVALVQMNSATAGWGRLLSFAPNGQNDYNQPGNCALNRNASSQGMMFSFNGSDITLGIPAYDTWMIVGIMMDGTARRLAVNGSYTAQTISTTSLNAAAMHVGGFSNGTGNKWVGPVRRVLVCSNGSLEILQRLEGYIAHSYGLTALLPVDHPYKTNPPEISFIPANTAAPAITGSPVLGQTLSVSAGTWDGIPPISFAYQWKRDGVAISGATASTYTLVSGDLGSTITCTVTATNGNGSSSADATGVGPVVDGAFDLAEWSDIWSTAGVREIVADADSPTGDAIRIANGASNNRIGFVWNTPGDIVGSVEVLVLLKQITDPNCGVNPLHGPLLAASGSAGSESGYAFARSKNLSNLKTRHMFGPVSSIVQYSTDWTVDWDQPYYMRLRWDGTMLYVRRWLASASEPGTWENSAAQAGLTGGKIGVFAFFAGIEFRLLYISYATGGGTAAMPP